jgi:hypothetical protein
MRAVVGLATVALLAACGGDGETYSVEATSACLQEELGSDRVSTNPDDLDFVAADAPGGGIRAEVGESEIEAMLAFGRTEGDAATLEGQYEVFAEAFDGESSLSRHGNVVIAWSFDPTDEERALVEDCLA